jgi:hypothetical protein
MKRRGVCYLIGWQINKIDSVSKEVRGLKKFEHDTIEEIKKLNLRKNHK